MKQYIFFTFFIFTFISAFKPAHFCITNNIGNQTIPLKSLRFDIHVIDSLMSVDIIQTYHNSLGVPMDALYVFPINSQMATTNLTVKYAKDNSSINALIFPKENATKIYQDAVERGHGAAYMSFDNQQEDILTLSLGNIEPNETLIVTVSFVQKLNVEDLSWAVRIPTTFTPQYSGSGIISNSSKTSTMKNVPYKMRLYMEIESSSPITRLISPSHEITSVFAFKNRKAYISLINDNDNESPNRDIIILYRNSLINTPQIVIQKSTLYDTYAILVSAIPFSETTYKIPVNEEIDINKTIKYDSGSQYLSAKSEFIFLIDCSGSMSGRIYQAKEAAKLFIKSLPYDSYFSFVFFGSEYRIAEPGHSVKYSKETADLAWKYLDEIDANMGGTELYAAIEKVLNFPKIDGYERNILVMTDGEVTNPHDVIELVKRKSKETSSSVHSIGIGTGASTYLVNGIANAGNGASYFISYNDIIMPKVVEALRNMCVSRIQNIRIQWPVNSENDIEIQNVPSSGFQGRPLVATAIIKGKPHGKLVMSGFLSKTGKLDEKVFEVDNMEFSNDVSIYQLAAKLSFDSIHEEEKVIEISRKYSVLSDKTAFVGIKFHPNRTDRETIEYVHIPISNTIETMGTFSGSNAIPHMQAGRGLTKSAAGVRYFKSQTRGKDLSEDVLLIDDSQVESAPQPNIPTKIDLISAINYQAPNGIFTVQTELIEKVFKKKYDEILQKLITIKSRFTDSEILQTILMIYAIDKEFSGEHVSLVRMKAISALSDKGVDYEEAKKEIEQVVFGIKNDL